MMDQLVLHKEYWTFERVSRELKYDPETGELWWCRPGRKRIMDRPAGCVNPKGYKVIRLGGRLYRVSHLIFLLIRGYWPEDEMDHKSRQRSDNRVSNLREASHIENTKNKSLFSNNTSSVAGVDRFRNKWRSRIKINYKELHLGLYDDFEDAVDIRRAAEKIYFGEFAPNWEGAHNATCE